MHFYVAVRLREIEPSIQDMKYEISKNNQRLAAAKSRMPYFGKANIQDGLLYLQWHILLRSLQNKY